MLVRLLVSLSRRGHDYRYPGSLACVLPLGSSLLWMGFSTLPPVVVMCDMHWASSLPLNLIPFLDPLLVPLPLPQQQTCPFQRTPTPTSAHVHPYHRKTNSLGGGAGTFRTRPATRPKSAATTPLNRCWLLLMTSSSWSVARMLTTTRTFALMLRLACNITLTSSWKHAVH